MWSTFHLTIASDKITIYPLSFIDFKWTLYFFLASIEFIMAIDSNVKWKCVNRFMRLNVITWSSDSKLFRWPKMIDILMQQRCSVKVTYEMKQFK